jgi:hypothetical protein
MSTRAPSDGSLSTPIEKNSAAATFYFFPYSRGQKIFFNIAQNELLTK